MQTLEYKPSLDRSIGQIGRARQALAAALRRRSSIDLSQLGFPIKTNGWTLSRDTLQLLVALVAELEPQQVFEFGSGLSTRALVGAASALPCRLTSIDHDPKFLEQTRQQLGQLSSSCLVSLHLAPLVLRSCVNELVPMYEIDAAGLASSLPADLILIDGPPAALGGRAGTLFQAMNFARPGSIILLDDANRPAERSALRMWRETFGGAVEVECLRGFAKGLAAILVHEPVPMENLDEFRSRLAARDLASVLQPDERFLLFDEERWNLGEVLPSANAVRFGGLDRAGLSPDSPSLLAELERCRAVGIRYVVVGWPAFWWLEYFPTFGRLLGSDFECVLENSRVAVFALR